LSLPHLGLDAGELLHVMPDLVRQHIGLSEVARSAKAPSQLIVEAQIDVNLLIGWTVERPGRGRR
jgi:hypothetical protein